MMYCFRIAVPDDLFGGGCFMRSLGIIVSLLVVGLLLCSCNGQLDLRPTPTDSRPTPTDSRLTPTVGVYADTFFGGCAYLDSNGNGEIDPDDLKLAGATFLVALSDGGIGFGADTSESSCALITVPGGLDEESWPVTARMEPPEGTDYKLVGPAEIVLEYPKTHADFLFTE
jgi:hypothetical protein